MCFVMVFKLNKNECGLEDIIFLIFWNGFWMILNFEMIFDFEV